MRRRRVRTLDTMALSVGAAISGVLAYVFFVVSARSLGAAETAPVSVLWTYWTFSGAALTFPLQHWIARTLATHEGEGVVRRALGGVAALVLSVSMVATVLAWLARDPLFGRDDPGFPVLVGCVTLGSALVGFVRGSLSARHRFSAVALALVLENGSRCLAAAVLVVGDAESALTLGICLAAGGPLLCLVWPSAFRFRRSPVTDPLESPFRFLGGASGGQLLAQVVLTGGPVLLALSGGSAAEVTALFAALALYRAPYTLAIGMVSQLTSRLTVLFIRGQHPELRRMRFVVLGGTVLTTVAAGVFGALAGPALLRLVFGDEVRLSSSLSSLIAVGSALALASLVMTVMIMAQGRSGAVARAWSIAVLAGAVTFSLLPLVPLTRTSWAFLVAEMVALAALVMEEVRGAPRDAAAAAMPSPPEAPDGPIG